MENVTPGRSGCWEGFETLCGDKWLITTAFIEAYRQQAALIVGPDELVGLVSPISTFRHSSIICRLSALLARCFIFRGG